MINFPRYLLTARHIDIPFYLLLDRDSDFDLIYDWINDLSWLYSLGGLHVCASLFLGLFTVNFVMNLKSTLHCPNCQGVEGGRVGGYYLSALWTMRSFESQTINFEAGRVVRIRKQQFGVLVWHARNHLTIVNELWELARRISIFITWGIKEVHSIKEKGLG